MDTVKLFEDLLLTQDEHSRFIIRFAPEPSFKRNVEMLHEQYDYVENTFMPWLEEHGVTYIDDRYDFPDYEDYIDFWHPTYKMNVQNTAKFAKQLDEIIEKFNAETDAPSEEEAK
jgi:hypothetical protein